jgi:hypothetical protein
MSDRSSGKTAATPSGEVLASTEGEPGPVPGEKDRLAGLIRTIEGEIVPRLLLSLSGSLTTAGDGREFDAVGEIAQHLLASEDIAAADMVRIIHGQGMVREPNFLGLLAPAARRLGELWERDECSFDQLLLGLTRLESVIREVNGRAAG